MIKNGDIFPHRVFSYNAKVVNYISARKVEVIILETSKNYTFKTDALENGIFKDPFYPTVYGEGFIGDCYKVHKNLAKSKPYKTWKGMLERCYCPKFLSKNPSYKGAKVCEYWKQYSNFKNWFDANYVEDYHLDKDLKVLNNMVYSPDTCTFVPKHVNSLFTGYHSDKNCLDIGVHWCRSRGIWYYQCCNSLSGKRVAGSCISKLVCVRNYLEQKSIVVEGVIKYYPALPDIIKDNIRQKILNLQGRLLELERECDSQGRPLE